MKLTRLLTLPGLAAMLCIAASVCAASPMASPSDRMFIHEAGYGGNDEIALSKVALMRSSDLNIRQFAHRMVVQHSQAGAQLKMIAMSLGVSVPAGPDPAHRMIRRHLEMLSGPAFDRAYIKVMVKDHMVADRVFQMGTTVTNDSLRNFAVTTLPIVEDHLKMASTMKQQMMNGSAMGAM